jgi:pilus assembly protein CpaE
MSDRPTVLLLESTAERHSVAASALAETARVSKERSLVTKRPSQQHKIVLVDLGSDVDRALETVSEVRSSSPNAQVVALADKKDPDVILRAMRAGACEFAVLGDRGELAGIVGNLLKRTTVEQPAGTIVSVFPAKGGVGATTLATNLAGAMSALGKSVLLVDLDRRLGDILVFLDMAPAYSIGDVVKNMHRLDRELLLSSLGRHSSGVFVLAHPDSIDDDETLGAASISSLLHFAARHFDCVVCDGLRGFDELSVAVLDASHRIELVLTQDVVALKNAKRCLDICNRLGYPEDKVDVVVNRSIKKAAIDLGSLAENLGRPVGASISNDYAAAVAALNRGVLLGEASPRSKLTQDIARLAGDIVGAKEEKQRGLFGSLFGSGSPKTSIAKEVSQYDVARRPSEAR